MIVKIKGGYRVISHRTGRNLGSYYGKDAKSKAEKRLKQIEMFKSIKSKSNPPKGSVFKKKSYNWKLRW